MRHFIMKTVPWPRRRGIASIVALIFLVMFAAIAVAFTAATNQTVLRAENHQHAETALARAESGLNFLTYVLKRATLPASAKGAALLPAVNTFLASQSYVVGNIGTGQIVYDGTTITVPAIQVQPGSPGFTAAITKATDTSITITVLGADGVARRCVSMDMTLAPGRNPILDYGIATKSSITLTGNDSISGKNNAAEANILSATYSTINAVSMTGNARIQGDVSMSNPVAQVSTTGNVSIGGATGAAMAAHEHAGIGTVDFPEVDQTVFTPFATNIIDAGTSTNGNKTFTNIRIRAGTNPTFSGNITIKGVVYIEKPNKVTFTGNLDFTGVIVTDDAGDNNYDSNCIKFTGNMTSRGVESLPDTSDFHDLRQLPGSFLLAPGFGVSFTGNFGTVNGTMAADKFSFTGNAGGTVYGSIINYSDSLFTMSGNSSLIFDRTKYAGTAPGLTSPSKLAANPGTYTEK